MVYLKDPEVFWENVGGSLTLPLLPLQTFDIDIGDTARIESIRIVDGQVRGGTLSQAWRGVRPRAGGWCAYAMHGRSRMTIDPSHPCNVLAEHVGFSPTRQTLLAPKREEKREVVGESHEE